MLWKDIDISELDKKEEIHIGRLCTGHFYCMLVYCLYLKAVIALFKSCEWAYVVLSYNSCAWGVVNLHGEYYVICSYRLAILSFCIFIQMYSQHLVVIAHAPLISQSWLISTILFQVYQLVIDQIQNYI